MTIHVLLKSSSTRGEPSRFVPIRAFVSPQKAQQWLRDLAKVPGMDYYAVAAYKKATFSRFGIWGWNDDGVSINWSLKEIELEEL